MVAETNILLPQGTVDLFVSDEETYAAAQKLAEDWRFARVTVNLQKCDIATAIEHYQSHESGDLVLVETPDIEQSFHDQLETLSGLCKEGCAAVVIGPVNDVNLYRSLTAMGVSDYLVNPVPFNVLSEVVAEAIIASKGVKGSNLVAVMGAKGGVGSSTISHMLARELSAEGGQKTLILDVAGGWSSLPVLFGFEPTGSLEEAIGAAEAQDMDTLDRMIFKVDDKLSILSVGAEALFDSTVRPEPFEHLLDFVMASYPFVVIDLSGASVRVRRMVVNRAHKVLLTTLPTLVSLRSTRGLIQEIKNMHDSDDQIVDVVVNMFGFAGGADISEKEIKEAIGYPVSLKLPYLPKLFVRAENEGNHGAKDKEIQDIQKNIFLLMKDFIKISDEAKESDDGIFSGLLKKVTAK